MNFMEAVKVCFSKYFDFEGRAARPELWWFVLFCVIGGIIASILDHLLFFGLAAEIGILNTIFSLATLVPTLAAGARRLHDIDRSGWWQLSCLLPIIGWILLIYWYIQPGQAEDNRFGSNPIG